MEAKTKVLANVDMKATLVENRLTPKEFSEKTNIPLSKIYRAIKEGGISIPALRQIEGAGLKVIFFNKQ